MKHRIVTAAQMKEIERAGDAHGLPYLQMMENAGLAAYAELQKQFPHPGRLLVVCGKGNNGGDGFVIARAAAKDGWSVTFDSYINRCIWQKLLRHCAEKSSAPTLASGTNGTRSFDEGSPPRER